MKISLAAAVTAVLLAGSGSAQVFDFEFTDSIDTAIGQFTTGPGGYPLTITGISGTFDGEPITGLSDYALADNVIYQSSPLYFSLGGFSFVAGGVDYNVYAYNGGNYLLNGQLYPIGLAPLGTLLTTAVITPAPEPATWALMLVGVFGIGLKLRRRPGDARVRGPA